MITDHTVNEYNPQMVIMAVFDMILEVMARVVMMAMTHTFMNSCAPYGYNDYDTCRNNC